MTESELDSLADKIAERLLQRPNIPPVLVRKRDISYMLGNSGRSTSTDQVINDPTFPPPVCVTEKGYKTQFYRDRNPCQHGCGRSSCYKTGESCGPDNR